jgi:hypothetical protein
MVMRIFPTMGNKGIHTSTAFKVSQSSPVSGMYEHRIAHAFFYFKTPFHAYKDKKPLRALPEEA